MEVVVDQSIISSSVRDGDNDNSITVHFTPIKAGTYKVSVLANGSHVARSPYSEVFAPGMFMYFSRLGWTF